MGGEQMRRTLEPHDQPAPDPTMTLEEFRREFTEDMRRDLLDGLELLQHHRFVCAKHNGLPPHDAAKFAMDEGAVGRRALQLLGAIHPQPYTW